MAAPTITYAEAVLGTISLPADAQAAQYMSWANDECPLELEPSTESDTRIVLAISDFHDNLTPNSNFQTAETTHVVGIRFTGDGFVSGSLTLDMRNTDIDTPDHTADNGEWPVAFSLGNDYYLVHKQAGNYAYWWTQGFVAYVVYVGSSGAPTIVDKLIVQAPGYYDPRREKIIFMAPTKVWMQEQGYNLTELARVVANDDFGCFGIAVSTSGFGGRTRYPDPPPPPNRGVPEPWEWLRPGQSINGSAILAQYHHDLSDDDVGTRGGLYYPETGAMTPLTNSYGLPFIASSEGEKGDLYTGIDNLYFTWMWNNNSTWSLSGNTFTHLSEWHHYESFETFGVVLSEHYYWSNRTWIDGEEYRYMQADRYEPNPPASSVAEVYDLHPEWHQTYPTYEDFLSNILQYYPSEQAYLDAYNSDMGTYVGQYVGFQTGSPTAETTIWATSDDEDMTIAKILGIRGSTYYTLDFPDDSVSGYPITIRRWGPGGAVGRLRVLVDPTATKLNRRWKFARGRKVDYA